MVDVFNISQTQITQRIYIAHFVAKKYESCNFVLKSKSNETIHLVGDWDIPNPVFRRVRKMSALKGL